jgi:hypothetical protein
MAQVVEHLPSKHKAPSSKPKNIKKNSSGKWLFIVLVINVNSL